MYHLLHTQPQFVLDHSLTAPLYKISIRVFPGSLYREEQYSVKGKGNLMRIAIHQHLCELLFLFHTCRAGHPIDRWHVVTYIMQHGTLTSSYPLTLTMAILYPGCKLYANTFKCSAEAVQLFQRAALTEGCWHGNRESMSKGRSKRFKYFGSL